MIDSSHVYHKKQDLKAAREVILDGVPSGGTDKWPVEIERAMERLLAIEKNFDRSYIHDIERFHTPNKDGSFPMKVVMTDPAIVTAILAIVKRDPKRYPWFRYSKTRIIRRNNARELRKVENLNGQLPTNAAEVWEAQDLGGIIESFKVPNSKVPLPAVMITATPGVNQRPVQAINPRYQYRAQGGQQQPQAPQP